MGLIVSYHSPTINITINTFPIFWLAFGSYLLLIQHTRRNRHPFLHSAINSKQYNIWLIYFFRRFFPSPTSFGDGRPSERVPFPANIEMQAASCLLFSPLNCKLYEWEYDGRIYYIPGTGQPLCTAKIQPNKPLHTRRTTYVRRKSWLALDVAHHNFSSLRVSATAAIIYYSQSSYHAVSPWAGPAPLEIDKSGIEKNVEKIILKNHPKSETNVHCFFCQRWARQSRQR